MPRVLIVARHFPPIGGAGVHRTVGSVRHLPAFGYDPVLVTGPGQQRGRWDAHDPALLAGVPAVAEIHRVPGPEPSGPTGAAARIARLSPAPDRWVSWWIDEAVRLGRAAGSGADLVLTSCAPYETALAGARLARELGVPWVADLEDPWALDEMRLHPTGLHRAGELRRMRAALAGASAIVMAAPEAAKRLRRAAPELDGAVTGIPIGFEPDDFAGEPRRAASDGVFRIVHTGSMHTDLGRRLRRTRLRRRLLGGATPGLDILTRSHVFLVEAIERLLAERPALRGKIELQLAGALTDGDLAVAAGRGFVRPVGLLPQRETIALMRSADLLFLPMQDLPEGERAGLIPYKTFEYLAAERPLLAAVPDGDVRDMLGPLQHVTLVRPGDVAAMTSALGRAVDAAPVERVRDGLGSPALRHLERGACVAEIARVLDAVLARVPALAAV